MGETMISERIRQARLAAGLTLEELAAQLTTQGTPLTKQALSKYENGKSVPKAALFLQLAKVLRVNPSYFVTEPTIDIEWKAFRRHKSLSGDAQERVRRYATQVAESQVELQALLYPDEQPDFPDPYPVNDFDAVEAAAEYVREYWKLDEHPVDQLVQLVESKGGVVVGWEGKGKGFDGLSGLGNAQIPITVVNLGVDADRLRFDLAHEIAHLLMDCEDASEDEQEKFAHRFAAAFLVPASVVRRELGTNRHHLAWDELGILKQRYGISMAAWIYRAKDLGIISESVASSLFRDRSARGWRLQEPNPLSVIERPTRLRQMVLRAVAEGIITAERGKEICPNCFEGSALGDEQLIGQPLSARALLHLPDAERERLINEAFDRAVNVDVEFDDQYSEADFDQA